MAIGNAEADIWYFQRDYDRAMNLAKQLLELDPNYVNAHWNLAAIYAQKGMYDDEMAEIETALRLAGLPDNAAVLRKAYTKSGVKGMLLKDIELASDPNRVGYYPAGVALDYARLGDKDNAFFWLERAWDERTGWAFFKIEPVLDSLRSDPRFADLLRRIGFLP